MLSRSQPSHRVRSLIRRAKSSERWPWVLHGLLCWFDAEVGEDLWVSNAPPAVAPSWSQALLPSPRPVDVLAGQHLAWKIGASANGERWRWQVEPTPLVNG